MKVLVNNSITQAFGKEIISRTGPDVEGEGCYYYRIGTEVVWLVYLLG